MHHTPERILGQPQTEGDVLVAAPFDRGLQHSFPLERWQRRKRSQCRTELMAFMNRGLKVAARGDLLGQLARGCGRQCTQGSVVDDSLEPGPRLGHHGPALKRHPRRKQPVLERVVRQVGRQYPPRPEHQRPLVALHQDLERALVACARELEQTQIGLPYKK
jgi:hypothetical protein